MTRERTFIYYWYNYVGAAIVIASVIALIAIGFGVVIYGEAILKPRRNERAFYLALEGKKTSNHQAGLAATHVWYMVKWEKLRKSGLSNLQALIKMENGLFYHEIYLAKKQAIDRLIGGKNINLSDTVKVPGWWIFCKWCLLIYWLWLAIWATAQLIAESCDYSESILEWPWHRVWTYPAILFMSPALLPSMMAEAGYRIAKGIFWQTLTGRIPEPQREQAAVSSTETANNRWLEVNKLKAQRKIAAAKEKIDESKQRWVDYCVRRADRTAWFERDIENLRCRLSDLGHNITQTQRDLAEQQKDFEAYKKEIKTDNDHEKYLKAFEQIVALAHVEVVELHKSFLSVFTDTLFITHQDRKYEIGNFVIVIDLAERIIVSTRNLCSTHPANRDHPYGHNVICFGILRNPINNALSSNEMALVVQYVLLALQSAEGDSPGRVREWKEVHNG